MARGALVYILLITCLFVYVIECRGGGRGRGGSGRGGKSRGGGHGGGGGWFGGGSSTNTGHTYPSSKTGLSGLGSRGSGSHSYPPHSGLSGGYGHGHPYHSQPNYHTYYSSPQYVYVHQYRNSGSQYGDLLIGLTLYNMARSHNNHPVYYYHDDYYRARYFSSNSDGGGGGGAKSTDNPSDHAACYLRVKQNVKEEVLKIPCEIISTFTKSGENITLDSVINTTLCVSNTTRTTVNNTVATTTGSTPSPVASTTIPSAKIEFLLPKVTEIPPDPMNIAPVYTHILDIMNKYKKTEDMTSDDFAISKIHDLVNTIETMTSDDITNPAMQHLFIKPIETTTTSTTEATTEPVEIDTSTVSTPVTPNVSEVNTTQCNTTIGKDPLKIKGERMKSAEIQCSVEVHTNDHILRNHVDCNELIEVAKKPEPRDDSILPPRHQLKSWIQKPPWWLSLFLAV